MLSGFFISNSKKALNTRLFWGTGEDGIGKCPIHQNSCYQETSSKTGLEFSLECKESDKTFEFEKQVSTETCHLQLVKLAAQ